MSTAIPRENADRLRLQQIIAGLAEGVILLDPDGAIVWANQAALGMHGAAELRDLGCTAAEYRDRFHLRYRNNHPVPPGSYPIERLVAGETFPPVIVEVWPDGENAPRWVHAVHGLALADQAARPDVLALVFSDETERFAAEERFERTFAANPAPAIICRLSDLRYVKVNAGFLEMTGHDRDSVLARTVYEIDVLREASDRALALDRLREGATIPQMEATLLLPDGASKLVLVAGQPIEMGAEPCLLFTFADLEPRRRTLIELQRTEARFATAFRLTPVPSLICELREFRIIDVNQAFVAITGYEATAVIGRATAELPLWEDAAPRRRFEHEVTQTGAVRNADLRFRCVSGAVLDGLVSAETVTIGEQRCVLLVMQDVTERRRGEAELIAAIDAVMQDASWFGRAVIERLANARSKSKSNRRAPELAELSAREREVLGLICQGLDNERIGAKLALSRNTVRNHVATIYRKVDVHTRSALIVWARERGVTGPESHPPQR